MKTYIRFSIALSLVFLPRVLNAQLQFRDTVDFDGPMSPGTAVYLDPTDTVNPWIIGDPQKSVFNHAFSEPFCIFTDTLVSVLPGDTSSFVVKFRYSSYSTFGIQFNTRLSFASRDTGYLQYSFDSLTWYHPVGDTAETDPCGSATVQYMLYPFSVSNSTDTVAAMDYMNFNCIPDLPYDTVYFRFTFVADTVQMLREGWMIDDIVFYTGLQANPPVTTSYGMRIYPNPVSDMMNLEWAQTLEEDLFIRIIDMQGKTVFTKISGPNFSYPLTLQLQDLQAGTYVLSVASGDKFFNQPFIKVER